MKREKMLFHLLLIMLLVSFSLFCGLTQSQEKNQAPSITTTTVKPDTSPEGPQPQIKFDREDLTYDMGDIPAMGKGEVTIKFKNVGKAELKIESVKAG